MVFHECIGKRATIYGGDHDLLWVQSPGRVAE